MPWIAKIPRLEVRVWNPGLEAKGTPVEAMSEKALKSNDFRNWKGGDLLRIVVLYKYGGLYFDLDVMFARDFAPLFNQDFIYNWPCPENREHNGDGNGAIMFSVSPKVRHVIVLGPTSLCTVETSTDEKCFAPRATWSLDLPTS
jgi:hypothetical protein